MTKQDLNTSVSKGKIHYLRDRPPGTHNKLKGTHGTNVKTCKACVSVMVAEIEYEGKLYAGAAIRNDHDQICRKVGRSIAMGRAIKNAMMGNNIDRVALDIMLLDSYKGNIQFLKEDWKKFLKFDKNA